MALPAGRYGVTKNQLLKIKKLPMNTIKLIEELTEKFDLLGTAAFKNSTSVVTESSDLVESGAVKDIVGWGNKNLLLNNAKSQTVVGVTFTVNADGSVTANETGSHASSSYLLLSGGFGADRVTLPDWLEIGKDYIVSNTDNGVKVLIAFYDANGDSIVSYDNTRFTVPSNTVYFGVFVYVGSNTHPSNVTVYPMIRKADVTDATYEPYHASVEESLAEKCDNTVIGTVEDGTNPTKAYAVNEFMVRDGAFCQVTAPVTTSSTWAEGSNYTKKSIAEVLQSLMS